MKTAFSPHDFATALPPPLRAASAKGLRITLLLKAAHLLLLVANRLAAQKTAAAALSAADPIIASREIEPLDHAGRPGLAVYENGRLIGWIDGVRRL